MEQTPRFRNAGLASALVLGCLALTVVSVLKARDVADDQHDADLLVRPGKWTTIRGSASRTAKAIKTAVKDRVASIALVSASSRSWSDASGCYEFEIEWRANRLGVKPPSSVKVEVWPTTILKSSGKGHAIVANASGLVDEMVGDDPVSGGASSQSSIFLTSRLERRKDGRHVARFKVPSDQLKVSPSGQGWASAEERFAVAEIVCL